MFNQITLIVVLVFMFTSFNLIGNETQPLIKSSDNNELMLPKEFLNLLFRDAEQCYVLLVETAKQTAYIVDFQKEPLRFEIIEELRIATGKQKGAKRSEWDLRTPVGFYEITQYRPPHTLDKKFGPGAYVLNYPNALDKAEKRTGSGIWVHGTDRVDFIDYDSEGCIRVENDKLPVLRRYLKPNSSPVIIVSTIEWVSPRSLLAIKHRFEERLNSWLQNNNASYDKHSLYHNSFYSPKHNKDKARWLLHLKENNNADNFIPSSYIFREDRILVELVAETSKSTNSKTLLWRLIDNDWHIILED